MLTRSFHRWSPHPGWVIFYEEVPGLAVSALDIMVGAGQVAESKEQVGYAHMVASIYDRGSAVHTDADMQRFECLDQAQIEGIVGDHLMGIECQIPSHRWQTMLDHAWQIFLEPRFETKVWEEEKQCVLAEIQTMEDYPEARLSKAFWAAMFPNHPYGQHPWGDAESLESSTASLAQAWYRQVLAQYPIYISMVGAQPVEEVQAHISRWTRPAFQPVEHTWPPAKTHTQPITLHHSGDKQMVQLGYATVGANHADRSVLEWIRHYWVNATMGVLYQRIREELGLVYGLDCFARYGQLQGCLGLSFSADPTNIDLIMEAINTHVQRLIEPGPSLEDMQRMQLYLEGQCLMEMDSPISHLVYRYQNEILGVTLDPWAQCKAMQSVTHEDLQRVAQTYLLKPCAFVTMAPQ